jgi:pimeloyl-ACP methyl ester carboxylesterase
VLLLAHATGFHGLVWRPLAEHLADRYRCVAWDFRGHGDSTAPAEHHFDWHGFAADVLTVVEMVAEGRPVAAVGHSKGGAALLLAEAERPGTFSALFCYEPIIFPVDSPMRSILNDDSLPLVGAALRRRDTFPSREEAHANFATKPPLNVLHPGALDAYVEHGFADQPDGSVTLKCRPADEAQMYRMGAGHDAWARLPEIRCPVAIACGEVGLPIGPDEAAAMAARLPHGEAIVFPGLGHFGPLQDPAGVAHRVAAWLEGC